MAPKEKAEAQTFTFNEVACMIAAMNTAGVVLGAKHYGLMTKLDGSRTTSSFEHKFRAVKARGKELATELTDGTATPKTSKTANKTKTSTGKKRGKKGVEADDDDDDEVQQTPSKKAKANDIKREPSEEASDGGDDGFELNGNHSDSANDPQ